MSNRDSCTHHFEHVKQTRPFTEREYMECSKCGLQNPLGLFQHHDVERDTREEIQQTWDNLKMAMAPVMKDLVKVWDELRHNRKLMDTIAQLQAIDQGNRYWHDHQGQPRRNPTMRPLIHNGKKPR